MAEHAETVVGALERFIVTIIQDEVDMGVEDFRLRQRARLELIAVLDNLKGDVHNHYAMNDPQHSDGPRDD